MEIVCRAGGLLPTSTIALIYLVFLAGRPGADLEGPDLERDPDVVDQLLDSAPIQPEDVFVIASNSGVNGSIVGLALAAKERGHRVIAVTSMEHTHAVTQKHASGRRLTDIAEIGRAHV